MWHFDRLVRKLPNLLIITVTDDNGVALPKYSYLSELAFD